MSAFTNVPALQRASRSERHPRAAERGGARRRWTGFSVEAVIERSQPFEATPIESVTAHSRTSTCLNGSRAHRTPRCAFSWTRRQTGAEQFAGHIGIVNNAKPGTDRPPAHPAATRDAVSSPRSRGSCA